MADTSASSSSSPPLKYEDLSEIQLAIAQNEAADQLMTVRELILASQELYLGSSSSSSSSAGDNGPTGGKASHHNLFKGLTKVGRAIATPKKRSSVASFSTPDKRSSTISTSSPATKTPSKVQCPPPLLLLLLAPHLNYVFVFPIADKQSF